MGTTTETRITSTQAKDAIYKASKVQLNKSAHVSIDDFFTALKDITLNESLYNSIFDNSTFNALKTIHDKYGTIFSCYCYINHDFDLKLTTLKFKQEFINNSSWLKFGFHGKDDATNYYNASAETIRTDYQYFIDALNIFASSANLTKCIRTASYNLSAVAKTTLINEFGLLGLMGADDSREQYSLSSINLNTLNKYYLLEDDISYFKTAFRIESFSELQCIAKLENLLSHNIISIFTHEYSLTTDNILKLDSCCAYLYKNKYSFSSLDNVIGMEKRVNNLSGSESTTIVKTFASGWAVPSGESLIIRKTGENVLIMGKAYKTTAITSADTIFQISADAVPMYSVITSCWAFNGSTASLVPLVIYSTGYVKVGFRNINASTGDTISILIQYSTI